VIVMTETTGTTDVMHLTDLERAIVAKVKRYIPNRQTRILGRLIKCVELMLLAWWLIGFIVCLINYDARLVGAIIYGVLLVLMFWHIARSIEIPHEPLRYSMELNGQIYGVLRPRAFPYWFPKGPFETLFWRKGRVPMILESDSMLLGDKGVDLADGTVINPNGDECFTEPIDEDWGILRSIYHVEDGNWNPLVSQEAGTTIRTYLNSLGIDDVVQHQKAGYNLIQTMKADDNPTAGSKTSPKHEIEALEKSFREEYGRRLKKILILDFGLPVEIVAAKMAKKKEELKQAAAEAAGLAEAIRRGTLYNKTVSLLRHGGMGKNRAQDFARDMQLYYRGTEKGAIVDWRSSGGSGGDDMTIEEAIAKFAKVFKGASGSHENE